MEKTVSHKERHTSGGKRFTSTAGRDCLGCLTTSQNGR